MTCKSSIFCNDCGRAPFVYILKGTSTEPRMVNVMCDCKSAALPSESDDGPSGVKDTMDKWRDTRCGVNS